MYAVHLWTSFKAMLTGKIKRYKRRVFSGYSWASQTRAARAYHDQNLEHLGYLKLSNFAYQACWRMHLNILSAVTNYILSKI